MIKLLSSRRIAVAGFAVLTTAVAAGFFVYSGASGIYFCDGRPMTAAQVAAHRGIDPDMIEQLHHNRSLDLSQICTLPQNKLERAMYRVQNPKPDHPGEWAKLRAMQSMDENGNIPDDGLIKAQEHVQAMAAVQNHDADTRQVSKTSWTWIGPGNIGGRVRSILIHPTTPATMWAGSVSGGIWKTTNGGTSWHVLTDFMSNMAVSTMIMDRTNPNIIYAGTGEGFFNADRVRGAGIFKTSNGGTTWARLASTNTADFLFVNRLANSPNNAVILAATETGIFRSINNGVSWSLTQSARTLDVDFDPINNAKAIASGEGGKSWYSTDGGMTWHASTGINSTGGFNNRVEVAYARSNGSIVYASSGFNNGTLYKSANGGKTFTQVNTGNSYLGSQGWYDNALWVDPTNPAVVIVGGIDLWRSTNSGTTLTKISQWFSAPASSAHADHHAIVNHPGYNGTTNKTVFFGNDGGVYRATDVKTVSLISGWQELNNDLGITQFYGAAGHVASGRITGGTQDNGTLFYTGSTTWTSPFGGDGGFSAAVPGGASPSSFFGEYVYLQIHRSNNGAPANYIYAGTSSATRLGDANSCALFIAPYILDPNNSNTMLAGGCSLWRSNNVLAGTPTWLKIKPASSGTISAIAVAPGNSSIIWVGYTNGDVYKTANGTAASPIWTKVDSASLPNRYVTRITIQKNTPNNVYLTFGGFFDGYTTGNIWKTTNGTTATPTWTNKHGSGATGLPSVPIRSVVIHPSNVNVIYVGTAVGIFVSAAGGGTWTVPQSGPTNTSVDELFFMGTTLYAATHGRGVFRSATLPVPGPATADASPATTD